MELTEIEAEREMGRIWPKVGGGWLSAAHGRWRWKELGLRPNCGAGSEQKDGRLRWGFELGSPGMQMETAATGLRSDNC